MKTNDIEIFTGQCSSSTAPTTSSTSLTASSSSPTSSYAAPCSSTITPKKNPEEEAAKRRAKDAERKRLKRQTESQEAHVERLTKDRERKRLRAAAESEDASTLRKARNAETKRNRQANESEDVTESRLAKNRALKSLQNEIMTQEERDDLRSRNADSHAAVRDAQSSEERISRNAKDAANKKIARMAESEEVGSSRRSKAAEDKRRREREEDDETRTKRLTGRALARQRSAARRSIEAANKLSSGNVNPHYLGPLEHKCSHCGALFFHGEVVDDSEKISICCSGGSIKIEPKFDDFPAYLKDLFIGNDKEAKNFQEHVRSFNSSLALASMGAQMDTPPGNGPFCFRIHGQVYHNIGALHPGIGKRPSYGQLYVLDTNQAAQERCQVSANSKCNPGIMLKLSELIAKTHKYAQSYKMMHEVYKAEEEAAVREGRSSKPVRMVFDVNAATMDLRRYNAPTSNEVAFVYVGEEGEIPESRSVAAHQKDGTLMSLYDTDPHADSMLYPLFFPDGQQGWHPKLSHEDPTRIRTRISQRQFYCHQIQIRGGFNPIHFGKNLFQQYAVDSHVKCEQNRLRWVRLNQKKIRADEYRVVQDYVVGDKSDGPPGRRVILPSSFSGSPRAMVQEYQDAMCIVAKYGKPDYFVTMTCNPAWREIKENLRNGQTASDRPDLIARVFQLKVDAFFDYLLKQNVLGEVASYVQVVEWQKRGLPHIHVLITMKVGSKPKTADDVDNVISAELPDAEEEPELYAIVSKNMIHRPCGIDNPSSPCMRDGKCSKRFPKPFSASTRCDVNGYPEYRRRNDGRFVKHGDVELTNQNVVPYNKRLLLLFNCHINAEICAQVESVKYLYKYVYKGNDRASIRMQREAENDGEAVDEIKLFLDCRYLCSPEAIHHLLSFPFQKKSDVIKRLAVHLPGRQTVTFAPGAEDQAVERADLKGTTLTAFFALNAEFKEREENAIDTSHLLDSRTFKYIEMPEKFLFGNDGKWRLRQKTGERQIGRMYGVYPGDPERFSLRLLLLHRTGPTSFEDLRTTTDDNGVVTVHPSFVEAAKAEGLLKDDEYLKKSLEEAASFRMPSELRGVFCAILAFSDVGDSETLWKLFKKDMSEDFVFKGYTQEESEALAYADLDDRLLRLGKSMESFATKPDTPVPFRIDDVVDFAAHQSNGERLYKTLNEKQKTSCDAILAAVEDPYLPRLFYLDGPGGSGKTYTYTVVHHLLTGMKKKCTAWTGIASTLLPEGRTAASLFKLSISDDCKTSSHKRGSKDANLLKDVDVFIWDEASMIPKHALETADAVLRDLMNNNIPFGGKILILGGDFRQVLPVVRRGSRADQVAMCIKSSSLWEKFSTFSLMTNMRVDAGDAEWPELLLRIGDGSANDAEGRVTLPDSVMTSGDLIEQVFGDVVDINTDVSEAAILAPKNIDVDSLNSQVHMRMEGREKVYLSRDEVEDESSNRYLTTEYLNSISTSSLPPHRLALKIGSVVMLLRNLDVSAGLCNGTRLVVQRMGARNVICTFATGSRKGSAVIIPKITCYEDKNLPFRLKRTQFPVKLSFAISVNKSQGQSFARIGLWLPEDVFTHGQAYVALSRVRSREGLSVNSKDPKPLNVVFQEVL